MFTNLSAEIITIKKMIICLVSFFIGLKIKGVTVKTFAGPYFFKFTTQKS